MFRTSEPGKLSCASQEQPVTQQLLQGPQSGPTSSDCNSWASVMPDTPLHFFCQLQSSDRSQAQSFSEHRAQTPGLPQKKILRIGNRRCVPSVRQACTLIPGATVFQDHASVSCHLFNEALWYGQWFGKLAKGPRCKINRTEQHNSMDIVLGTGCPLCRERTAS